jgi:hypothetical protein
MHELSEAEQHDYAAQVAEQAVFGHLASEEPAEEPASGHPFAEVDLQPPAPGAPFEAWDDYATAATSLITFGGRR